MVNVSFLYLLPSVLDKNITEMISRAKWTTERQTPLHCAAANGHFEVFKLIFDSVANKNLSELLHVAVFRGHFEIFELIMDHITNPGEEHIAMELARKYGHHRIVDYFKSVI